MDADNRVTPALAAASSDLAAGSPDTEGPDVGAAAPDAEAPDAAASNTAASGEVKREGNVDFDDPDVVHGMTDLLLERRMADARESLCKTEAAEQRHPKAEDLKKLGEGASQRLSELVLEAGRFRQALTGLTADLSWRVRELKEVLGGTKPRSHPPHLTRDGALQHALAKLEQVSAEAQPVPKRTVDLENGIAIARRDYDLALHGFSLAVSRAA